jgi:hypothetical protein
VTDQKSSGYATFDSLSNGGNFSGSTKKPTTNYWIDQKLTKAIKADWSGSEAEIQTSGS